MTTAESLIAAYYATFNAGDRDAFLALLTEDILHGINQGPEEVGIPAFKKFLACMDTCYREQITDITILTDSTGTRAAAEFTVNGIYLQTDPGLPEARGQTYTLPAGAFFTLRGAKIARISNHYNLPAWTAQILA